MIIRVRIETHPVSSIHHANPMDSITTSMRMCQLYEPAYRWHAFDYNPQIEMDALPLCSETMSSTRFHRPGPYVIRITAHMLCNHSCHYILDGEAHTGMEETHQSPRYDEPCRSNQCIPTVCSCIMSSPNDCTVHSIDFERI